MKITNIKEVYVVVGNTDNTEGRGDLYPICFCEKESTAIRLSEKRGLMIF